MKRFSLMSTAFLTLLLAACSGPDSFRVSVEAPEVGTQEMRVVYTTPSGQRATQVVAAINGSFEFEGSSPEPAVVEIYNARKRLFATVIAADGDNVKLTVPAGDEPMRVEGSELSARLLSYIAGDTVGELPPAVARAIDLTQTVHSRSVWPKFISPEVIISKDSVYTFPAEGIWIFTAADLERSRQVMDTIRLYAKRKLPVRDIYVAADTTNWRLATRRDSASWSQAMMPDAPLVLGEIVRSTPCLVEVDTAGTVLRVQSLQ